VAPCGVLGTRAGSAPVRQTVRRAGTADPAEPLLAPAPLGSGLRPWSRPGGPDLLGRTARRTSASADVERAGVALMVTGARQNGRPGAGASERGGCRPRRGELGRVGDPGPGGGGAAPPRRPSARVRALRRPDRPIRARRRPAGFDPSPRRGLSRARWLSARRGDQLALPWGECHMLLALESVEC
jgi:hypothetical protein